MPRLWLHGEKPYPGGFRHKVIGFVDAATALATPMAVAVPSRHKVIGFVDAATMSSRVWTNSASRHKVIGFVDAATAKTTCGQKSGPSRHKVIGFVDAATVTVVGRVLYEPPPQGHWLRGCRDYRSGDTAE